MSKAIAIWALLFARLETIRNLLTAMSLLPKSIHWCRRYSTKFNSGWDIPAGRVGFHRALASAFLSTLITYSRKVRRSLAAASFSCHSNSAGNSRTFNAVVERKSCCSIMGIR